MALVLRPPSTCQPTVTTQQRTLIVLQHPLSSFRATLSTLPILTDFRFSLSTSKPAQPSPHSESHLQRSKISPWHSKVRNLQNHCILPRPTATVRPPHQSSILLSRLRLPSPVRLSSLVAHVRSAMTSVRRPEMHSASLAVLPAVGPVPSRDPMVPTPWPASPTASAQHHLRPRTAHRAVTLVVHFCSHRRFNKVPFLQHPAITPATPGQQTWLRMTQLWSDPALSVTSFSRRNATSA